ncbi:CoA-dependent acyltransferase, partial [Flagelloscypha sp. PMI_526]
MFLTRPFLRGISRVSHFHSSALVYAAKTFKLADIGEGITECEIIKWSVQPKSTVQSFDVICEVQSDKASVEITSPFDGIVTQLLVQEGDVAKVGSGLCIIEVDEEGDETVEAPSETITPQPVTPAPSSSATPLSSVLTPSAPTTRPHPLDPSHRTSSPETDVLATPSVRHFAMRSGVDLALLAPGSGKNGRIEKSDVDNYLNRSSSDVSSSSLPSASDVIVELGRTRYGMWKAMEKSLEIPHFGYSTSLDITELHDKVLPVLNKHIPQHYLPESSRRSTDVLLVNPAAIHPLPSSPNVSPNAYFTRLTYLPFLLKTLAIAMNEWPLLRSSITPDFAATGQKPTLTIRPKADISLALSTPSGLYTPTLQDVGKLGVYDIMAKVKELGYKGRQTPSQLTPSDMPKRGGTITVSNVGAIGQGESAHPVLVPGGGVAIVALGRAKWVWDVDTFPSGARRLKLPLSWSADHRVVEGAELAAFVECWRGWVEEPARLVG